MSKHFITELSILTLVLRILYTFTCVLNYPYFPWCCVFSTLSTVFWITNTSPGVVYFLHFYLCIELPIPYWFCVFCTLLHVFWITVPILSLELCILYTFTCILNYPYFPRCGVFTPLLVVIFAYFPCVVIYSYFFCVLIYPYWNSFPFQVYEGHKLGVQVNDLIYDTL